MSNQRLAILMAAAAVLLNLSLTQYRTNRITTYSDGHMTRTVEDAPLLVSTTSVADVACFEGRPCPVWALATESGWYARYGLPVWVAGLGGMLAPYLLAIGALFLAVEDLQGRRRKILGMTLRLPGATVLFGFAYLAAQAPSVPVATIVGSLLFSGLGAVLAVAVALSGIGGWLVASGRRSQPASR